MVDIGFIGLGHMGFPMARRRSAAPRRSQRARWPVEIAEAVARLWEATLNDEGADSDFTSAIKPIERAAGVTVGNSEK